MRSRGDEMAEEGTKRLRGLKRTGLNSLLYTLSEPSISPLKCKEVL